jgi:hypothetical protein
VQASPALAPGASCTRSIEINLVLQRRSGSGLELYSQLLAFHNGRFATQIPATGNVNSGSFNNGKVSKRPFLPQRMFYIKDFSTTVNCDNGLFPPQIFFYNAQTILAGHRPFHKLPFRQMRTARTSVRRTAT